MGLGPLWYAVWLATHTAVLPTITRLSLLIINSGQLLLGIQWTCPLCPCSSAGVVGLGYLLSGVSFRPEGIFRSSLFPPSLLSTDDDTRFRGRQIQGLGQRFVRILGKHGVAVRQEWGS